jgi:hypothetical protein
MIQIPCSNIEAIFRTNANCNFQILCTIIFALCCPEVLDRAHEGQPPDLVNLISSIHPVIHRGEGKLLCVTTTKGKNK